MKLLVIALVLIPFAAAAADSCEDHLVDFKVPAAPAVWRLGSIPHLFINCKHMRGTFAYSSVIITGLKNFTTSLKFCPLTGNIHGNVSGFNFGFHAHYTSNMDYINNGLSVFLGGDGILNFTLAYAQITNIRAPLIYDPIVKKLQIADSDYNAREDIQSLQISGLHGENNTDAGVDQVVQTEKMSQQTFLFEFFRALANLKISRDLISDALTHAFEPKMHTPKFGIFSKPI